MYLTLFHQPDLKCLKIKSVQYSLSQLLAGDIPARDVALTEIEMELSEVHLFSSPAG